MTINVPRWLIVVLALTVVGGGALYGGYRWGSQEGRAEGNARADREQAKRAQSDNAATRAGRQQAGVAAALLNACEAAGDLRDPDGRPVPYEHQCGELTDPLALTKEICIRVGTAIRGDPFGGGVCPPR